MLLLLPRLLLLGRLWLRHMLMLLTLLVIPQGLIHLILLYLHPSQLFLRCSHSSIDGDIFIARSALIAE